MVRIQNIQPNNAATKHLTNLGGQADSRLDKVLNTHLPSSPSRIPPLYRETTKCYAYMCQYAYGCTEKTGRAAQVLMRRCMRYMPKHLRIQAALSEFALDLLAVQRKTGEELSQKTTAILDEHRPDGPVREILVER